MQSPVGVRGREGGQRWCSSLSYKDTVVSKQGGRVSNCSQGIRTLVPRLGYNAREYTHEGESGKHEVQHCGSKTCHPNLMHKSHLPLLPWTVEWSCLWLGRSSGSAQRTQTGPSGLPPGHPQRGWSHAQSSGHLRRKGHKYWILWCTIVY